MEEDTWWRFVGIDHSCIFGIKIVKTPALSATSPEKANERRLFGSTPRTHRCRCSRSSNNRHRYLITLSASMTGKAHAVTHMRSFRCSRRWSRETLASSWSRWSLETFDLSGLVRPRRRLPRRPWYPALVASFGILKDQGWRAVSAAGRRRHWIPSGSLGCIVSSCAPLPRVTRLTERRDGEVCPRRV